jgi:hypothetical protein
MKLQSQELDILDYVLYIGLFAMQEDRVHHLILPCNDTKESLFP